MGVRGFLKKLIRGPAPAPAPASASAVASRSARPEGKDADGYVAVAPIEAVQPGQPGQYDVGGHTVAVFRVDQALFAIDNACLHEDGPLGEAAQDGFVVTCPYHDWRYDLRDGKCLTTPGRRVGCWKVREKAGWVWVGPALSASSRDRGGEHDDGLKSV